MNTCDDLTGSTPQPVDGEGTPVPEYFNTSGPIITTTSATSTPVPEDAPSPTPQSLQKGFTDSDAVREVQKRLKELGYY